MNTPRVTWSDDYETGYVETPDPRVLAIIKRDRDSEGPDGDSYAPAVWLEYRNGWCSNGAAGATFQDDDSVSAYLEARNRAPYYANRGRNAGRYAIDSEEFAARYMRAFHATAVELVTGQDSTILLLNTPAFRAHVGIDNPDGTRSTGADGEPMADSVALSLDGESAEFSAWLDGDVYGVGYAVNPARVTEETPVDYSDGSWEESLECWGFFGEEYALESAIAFEHGAPNLPTLLDFPSDTTTQETAI